MQRQYNQRNAIITINGITIDGFFEGATITYTQDGGEVDKTQGTDGAAINKATGQGGTLKFTLRESSKSRLFLNGLEISQSLGGPGALIIIRTGVDAIHTMFNAFFSRPGELSTGDKKMGSIQYTAMSANDLEENLVESALGIVGL